MQFQISYKNLLRLGTIINFTDEASEFPVENMQVDSPGQPWRSLNVTGTKVIDFDLGSAQAASRLMILGHKLSSAASISAIFDDDSGFSTGAQTEAITWTSGNIIADLSAVRTKRYVRLSIADAGNPLGYLEIGTVGLYRPWTLSRYFIPGKSVGRDSASPMQENDSRSIFGQPRPTLKKRVYSWERGLSDTDAAYIDDFLAAVEMIRGFLINLDAANPYSGGWLFMRNAELIDAVKHNPNDWSWALSLIEKI